MSLFDELELGKVAWAKTRQGCLDEMPRVVEALAKIAALIGETTGEHSASEAAFRHWRSICMAAELGRNMKLSEWKARVDAESSVTFVEKHTDIANNLDRLEKLKGYQVALLAKRDFIVAALAKY